MSPNEDVYTHLALQCLNTRIALLLQIWPLDVCGFN